MGKKSDVAANPSHSQSRFRLQCFFAGLGQSQRPNGPTAQRPNGPAGRCKQLVDRGVVELFVSEEVLAEMADVLSRSRTRKLAPALTLEVIEAFIAGVRLKAICLWNVPEEYRFERDPKDACYLNLAIVARAKFIVSRDNDLLDLMKPRSETAREFQRRFPLLKIINPTAYRSRNQIEFESCPFTSAPGQAGWAARRSRGNCWMSEPWVRSASSVQAWR